MTLYDTLELDKTASSDEIKRAYHKLAKKYHPDKNNNDPTAVEKFKEIKNAYEVLHDEERRKLYDMTGGSDTIDFFQNVFQNIFQRPTAYAFSFTAPAQAPTQAPAHASTPQEEFMFFGYDILNDLDVDAMFVNINEMLNASTNTSLASQAENMFININSKLEDIFTCQVKDVPITRQRLVNNQIGDDVKTFQIPLFVSEIVFKNSGSIKQLGERPGDLIVNIYSKRHERFRRIKQFDLLLTETISFQQVYQDYLHHFIHLDGQNRCVKILAKQLVDSPIIKLSNQGLPKNCRQKRGDLYIYFYIQLPATLSPSDESSSDESPSDESPVESPSVESTQLDCISASMADIITEYMEE